MTNILKLYKFVNGVNDTPFPNANEQSILYEFRYDAKRMGNIPTISGTILHPLCLDNLWGNDVVYVVYNDERYFLKQTPTSSYSNEDTRYKHEVEFVSERIVLNDVYFYDVVASDTTNDKPVSNSSNFTFYGDIHEFAQRLNYSLQYAKVGYNVVVDIGITSEAKLVSFQDQFIANALQEIFNTYNLPYYYFGKVIHIGYANNNIEHIFKYGIDNALLSITKTNANQKIVNRVTGIGSADNIPYYYPNKDEKGDSKALYNGEIGNVTIANEILYRKVKLSDEFTYKDIAKYTNVITDGKEYTSDNELVEIEHNIWELWPITYPFTIDKVTDYVTFEIDYYAKDLKFINIELWSGGERIYKTHKVGEFTRVCGLGNYEIVISIGIYSEDEELSKSYADTIIGDIGVRVTQEIDGEVGWYLNDKKNNIVRLEDYGLSISDAPQHDDKITFKQYSYIKPQINLMPPIYRNSLGDERFYNALNNTFINPETKDYYAFENPYQDGKPKEHIVSFEDIKPSIVGMTNASGARIDMFSEFAWDENDNDEFDEEGNYLHPYFFGKLRKFDGEFGFNLFDHAIEEDEMVISMTSGSCGACNFVIGVDIETQKNIVQVDDDGNLKRSSDGNVLYGSPQARQNDTQNNEVWIALKKDINTFGVIMPNASNNYKPKAEDTFVILHIDLPQSYILAAENRLKEEIIKYMAMNNSEKFTFSINFSRIFFAENPYILTQLNENSRLNIEYNNSIYSLYVSSYSYSMSNANPLPEIRVELSDTLTIAQNALQNAIDTVKGDIINRVDNTDWTGKFLDVFLRKDIDDRSKGRIASDRAIEVGKFVNGVSGAIIYVDTNTGQSIAEVDKLFVRMKAHFEQLEIINSGSVGGKQIISPAGSLRLSNVVDNGNDYYRCYFLSEQDGEKVQNRFMIGDQAYCELFNAKSGVYNNISNKYYWRLVVGVGEDYIDLSKSDCDSGSDIPEVGDVICHRGNRNDVVRQNLIEFSSVDTYSPSIILYQGINTYSLSGKDIVSFGVDKTTNRPFMNVYGDMYVGNRSNTSYMRYTPENGLELKGRLAVGTTLSDGRDLEQAIRDAKPENYEEFVESVTNSLGNLQNQVDGAIDSYFLEYDATLSNYPASEWVTDEEKQAHLGDTFTNNITGDSWRWGLDINGNYAWIYISDTATKKALETASKAQDTADGKRRVFIETPFPPYDLGDLWAGGSSEPLRRCIIAKGSGSFDAGDWDYADNTTEKLAGYEYLKRALGESTSVEGGLVQTSLLMLGYTDANKVFHIMSGTNGLYDSSAKGGGIAAWYGGPMADKEADSSLVEFAQSLFRFDGSGYLAGGKISWDAEGAGKVANGGISWDKNGIITLGQTIKISGDADETLGNILAYVNTLLSWFGEDDEGNIYLKKDGDKARSFYAFGEVSSFGLSTEGDGSGGVTALAALTDVSVSNPTDGQSLVYDNASGKWVNKTVSGGISEVTVKLGTTTYNSTNGVVSLPAYPVVPTALSGFTNDVGFLTSVSWSAVTGKPTFATVATSGKYSDLTGLPTIPTSLKNPYALSWSGYSSGSYDGGGTANIVIPTSLPASDVYDWAKAATKPSYAFSEITGKPTTLAGYGITDALSVNGGTIKGATTYPLIVSNSVGTLVGTIFSANGANRAIIFAGGDWHAAIVNPQAGYKAIGVRDDGTPFYGDGSTQNTLLHSANYASYALPLSGGTINGNLQIGAENNTSFNYLQLIRSSHYVRLNNTDTNAVFSFGSYANNTATNEKAIWMGDNGLRYVVDNTTFYDIIHSGNIGEQSVNSATKLQTARTIWGQSFDGTGNVSGGMSNVGTIQPLSENTYNLGTEGATWKYAYINAILNNTTNGFFIGSRVGIGAKDGGALVYSYGSTPISFYTGGERMRILGNGNILIDTTTDMGVKLYVAGNFTASGEVTSGSDKRYKRILSHAEIDIKTIANAPIINFKWTDREDDKVHLGSTAQYWYNTAFRNGVTPTDDEKLWTMGYGQIALASVVSVAKKVVNHEERIAALEKENKELKQQLNDNKYGL